MAQSRNGAICVLCMASDGQRQLEPANNEKCPECVGGILQLDYQIATKNNNTANGSNSGGEQKIFVEKCVPCPKGMGPNLDGTACVPCSSMEQANDGSKGGCGCGLCQKQPAASFAIPLFDSDEQFASDQMSKQAQSAQHWCREGMAKWCQRLANFCVLQDYIRVAGGACMTLEQARSELKREM